MSPALLFHYLTLNMFRVLAHPSSGACDLFVESFRGLYCSGTMRVGVTLWFGWRGVVSGCRLKQYSTCQTEIPEMGKITEIPGMGKITEIPGMGKITEIPGMGKITEIPEMGKITHLWNLANACCCMYSLELLMMD